MNEIKESCELTPIIETPKYLRNTRQAGEATELLSTLEDKSVSLVFFDPQYEKAGDVLVVGNYPMHYQSEYQIIHILKEISRILKPSGFCLLTLIEATTQEGDLVVDPCAALIQEKVREAAKGKYNAFQKYKYFDEYAILRAIKPLLSEQKLTLTFDDVPADFSIEKIEKEWIIKYPMGQNTDIAKAKGKKAQEQSLKLAQFYTPECLVDLCIELLQPKDELFDPCCGLGSFLSKAKSKDEHLKISGNDIAQDLGELPFNFSQGDYLKTEDQGHDYIIITNTRKRALIILPAGVNSCLNPKLANERKKIIESGKLELVCQLPSHLFNKTGIAPVLEEIEEGNFMLVPNRYEREEPSELTPEEIDQQIRQTTKELYQMTQELDEL
ncbi:34693_t:CDS:2 [Gigaspora margarita]|uniref:34693_t:CDS:1 n=1 Tax=Gigaspora margarita TaxID=4874 RepID=A0ABN7UIX8_GIGMA|nr:34693_t:CDS:2 [Gigaspora margarita]